LSADAKPTVWLELVDGSCAVAARPYTPRTPAAQLAFLGGKNRRAAAFKVSLRPAWTGI